MAGSTRSTTPRAPRTTRAARAAARTLRAGTAGAPMVPVQVPVTALAALDDRALGREAGRGDERAFAILYERLTPALFRWAVRLVKDRDTAQDLVQDTMVRAWEARTRYDARYDYDVWLRAILNRRRIDTLRHDQICHEYTRAALERSERLEHGEMLDGLGQPAGAPPDADAAFLLELQAVREILAPLLGRIRPEERAVLEVWAAGGPLKDLAASTGLPEGTVRSLLSRGKRRLAALYAAEIGLPAEALAP